MEQKKRNRIKYWAALFNPVMLGCLFLGMRTLARLCMYGGVRRRLPVIGVCGFLLILWLIVWTAAYFRKKRKSSGKVHFSTKQLSAILIAELLAAAVVCGYYGQMIWKSAQPYEGRLSWKLEEWRSKKSAELTRGDIYRDGLEGIFEDPESDADLPEEQIVYETNVCKADPKTGELYYMFDDGKGWRLAVSDAAAGSRWYRLESTSDGGMTWQTVNESPFGDSWGVAAAIEFYDEQFGFLLLSGASETQAELYVTRDAGASVSEISLPREELPLPEEEAEKYCYTTMPVKKGGVWQTELRREKYDSQAFLFESDDDGRTWKYAGALFV